MNLLRQASPSYKSDESANKSSEKVKSENEQKTLRPRKRYVNYCDRRLNIKGEFKLKDENSVKKCKKEKPKIKKAKIEKIENELLGSKRVSQFCLKNESSKNLGGQTKRAIKSENKENENFKKSVKNRRNIDTPRLKKEFIKNVKNESSSNKSRKDSNFNKF